LYGALNDSLQKFRDIFLIAGLLLLILGVRIFIGIRFITALPQLDDGSTLIWLQNWANGIHDWGFAWARHNSHPMPMYYFMNLGQYLLNGYWDGHLDFLVYAFIHTAYAAVVILTFWKVLTPQDRRWLLPLIFLLFVVPFAGYRIAWGFLWLHTAMMLFSLWTLYVAVHKRETWAGVGVTSLLALLAAFNSGAGCLAAFMVVALTLFRAVVARRLTRRDEVLSVICLIIFLSFYLTMSAGVKAGLLEGCDALFKALAWPMVFIPGAGIFTLIPLGGLAVAYIYSPSFRTRSIEYIMAIGGLLLLISVAAGAFRGENQNMGMPSGRYTDIFIMVPLVSAVALCLLCRGSSGRYRLGWNIFAFAWICFQILGFSIHILYRTLPFMALENGEWSEPNKLVLFRNMVRGAVQPILNNRDPLWDGTIDLPLFKEGDSSADMLDIIKGRKPVPAMTLPMITGFPLLPESQGNYTVGGYHPAYRPRPAQLYTGSFDADHRTVTDKWFLSGPFQPTANYITLDLLLDKRARFTNYRLDGLQLILRDEATGQRRELLPQLSRSFPFIFRDWELIYAPVTPGHVYRIESHDSSPNQWIAFGEPFESGKLTPLIVTVGQSGKFLSLCGLAFLVLAWGLDRLVVLRRLL